MNLQEEVKLALSSCSVHDADSFVVLHLSNELRAVFDRHRNFVDRWNVISEIERQVGGFYVFERTDYNSGFIHNLTFRRHLFMIDLEKK